MRDEYLDHFWQLRALSRPGQPLSAFSPAATMNRPENFGLYKKKPVPTNERRELHAQLLRRFSADVVEGRQALVMAGPPGAGKSTLRDLYLGEGRADYLVIDPDEFKRALIRDAMGPDDDLPYSLIPRELKEHVESGAPFAPMDFAGLVHRESSYVAQRLQSEAIKQGKNVVLDQMLASRPQAEDLGRQLEKRGYTVRVFSAEASRPAVEQGILERYRRDRLRPDSMGGRAIPSDTLEHAYGDGDQKFSRSYAAAMALAESSGNVVELRQMHRELGEPMKLHGWYGREAIGAELEEGGPEHPGRKLAEEDVALAAQLHNLGDLGVGDGQHWSSPER